MFTNNNSFHTTSEENYLDDKSNNIFFPEDPFQDLLFYKNYGIDYPKDREEQSHELKTKLFITKKKKRRGRKTEKNNSSRKIHSSDYIDNCLRKIQINFLTFLVNFSNDAIQTFFNIQKNREYKQKYLYFKQIEYEIKSNINYSNLEYLKASPINIILRQKISDKYRNLAKDKDYNEKIYNKTIASSGWLKNLFDMNFIELFEKYYNHCKPQTCICFEDKTITFSKNTKPFYSLYIQSTREKQLILEKLVKKFFLDGNKIKIKKEELINEK